MYKFMGLVASTGHLCNYKHTVLYPNG